MSLTTYVKITVYSLFSKYKMGFTSQKYQTFKGTIDSVEASSSLYTYVHRLCGHILDCKLMVQIVEF